MDPTDALPDRARRLVEQLFGGDAHVDWSRVPGHEVWRGRQHETGETVVVKSGMDVATARAVAESGVAPRLLAADDASGICVLEDLGPTTLLDILSARDAEAGTQGLLGLASVLGKLHGWSGALEPSQLRFPPPPRLPLPAFMNICGAFGVDAFRARDEFTEAERCARSEGPQVVVHGDPCPDNFVPGESTETPGKFIDFEATHRGNALFDAACWHMPFPTGWRVARVPAELLPRMDAAYQAGLAATWPQLVDTATFQRLLAAACVYWLVSCLTGKRFIEAYDDRFAGPAFASVRERGLLWLDNAAATIDQAGHFQAAGEVARELAERLRQRWAPMDDAPLYPAFRSQASRSPATAALEALSRTP